METTELIQKLINELNGQIEIREMVIKALVGAIVTLVMGFVTFFMFFNKEKHKSDAMFKKMNEDFLAVIKDDIEAKKDLKHALENNTKAIGDNTNLIQRFPDVMKDTIMTAFKLSGK